MVGTVVIKRVFNNNVAMVTSDDGSELIVIGRGLCFGRHAGDAIDEASVEKTYALQEGTSQDSRTIDRLAHLLESIPTVNLVISEDIVQMLRRELNVDINDKILIALADHISLALERERKGVPCENPLLLEIQQFYRKEYALAGRALQIIKEYMGIQMSEEEQGFITLHIVNATMPQRSDRLIVSVQLVRDVLAIVSEHYATTLDVTSLPYERFVRHLQFFAQRALDPAAGQVNGDALFRIDETAYPRAFSCAESIADHLASTYNVVVTDAEKSYLAYHIVNLLGEPGLEAYRAHTSIDIRQGSRSCLGHTYLNLRKRKGSTAMTAKKKFNFKAPLEVFAKSIVQPMMYLSVAGILLIVGIILTNKTICAVVPVLGSGPFQLVGAVVYQSLMFIINNLSILFCVGIAGAMAKKNKGHASLIALMSFFLFLQANNIVLNATGSLAEASGMLGLTGTGQSTVMGIQVLDTGVFGGIILGCITGAVFNKYSNKQFPIALSMFSGVRFPFLIMIIISWIMGAGFCIVWPPVQGAISSVAGIIKESGNIGLFIYGMLNKLLVPTGLHHLIYTPFQFSDVGGTLTLGDQVIAGAYPIRVAEMAMTGQPFSDSTYFNSYTFNNLWPYIGIGLAFIFTAYKQNKDKTKAVIIPLIITAVLSCVTEPMDFLFVFAAPVLFVVHSVLSGIFLVLLKVLSVPASTAGGIINIVVSNLVLGVDKTNWPMMLVLGVVNAALYFFLFTFLIKKLNLHTPGREEESELAESVAEGEAAASVAVKQGAVAAAPAEGVDAGIADLVAGLGGKDNIEELENCFTRLRVNVKNPDLINEDLINHVPNSGINRNGNNIQIIFGMKVAEMRDKVENAIEKEQ